jgi:hypothetical protein
MVKLDADDKLVGTLVNHTGYDLVARVSGLQKTTIAGGIGNVSSQDSDINRVRRTVGEK